MYIAVLAVLCLIAPAAALQPATSVRGRIVDAQTAEPLARVKVIVDRTRETTTDGGGYFTIAGLSAGEAELYVTAVGYGVVRKAIRLVAGVNEVHDIALNQEGTAVTEHVIVTAPAESPLGSGAASQKALNKAELQALSMVIIGDPLRATQSLPGVVANGDLRGDFAVRAAGFDRVSVYVDGVLTDRFVHTLSEAGTTDQLSLALINQDTVSAVTLFSAAFPSTFGNSSAAVLDLETRDGSRVRNAARISTGFLTSAAVFDGPIAAGRGSWLVAARTSRLDYLPRLVQRLTGTLDKEADDGSRLDFDDLQAKAVYDLSPRHQAGASVLTGIFAGDEGKESRLLNALDSNALSRSDSRNRLVTAYWRFTPGGRVFTKARVFMLHSGYVAKNPASVVIETNRRDDAGFRVDTGIAASPGHYIEAGAYVRSARGQSRAVFFPSSAPADPQIPEPLVPEDYDRRALEQAYYVQDTWTAGAVSATGGGRLEHSALTGETLFSPRLAVRATLGPDWTVRGALGRYLQEPSFGELFGFLGSRELRAASALHYTAAIERRVGARTWAVVEAYDREDRGQVFSLSEPRLERGGITAATEPFRNALDGYARGIELVLQRRSANGLMGWMSYAYGVSSSRDDRHGLVFPSDADQRHTVNTFASYRFTGTFAVTGEWRYGSATPLRGFLQMHDGILGLGSERNQLRAPVYSRLDARVSKVFRMKRGKLTLAGEVLNVLNHFNEYNVQTSLIRVAGSGSYITGLRQSFPRVPSLGVAIEF